SNGYRSHVWKYELQQLAVKLGIAIRVSHLQPVLNFVPLAGPRREVADADSDAELVGELLERVLPDMRPVAVAAPGVGGDEQFARVRIPLRPDLAPPGLDRRDGEHGRVVVNPDTDEAIVGADVVDAVRNGLADRVLWKVVNVHKVGLAFGL